MPKLNSRAYSPFACNGTNMIQPISHQTHQFSMLWQTRWSTDSYAKNRNISYCGLLELKHTEKQRCTCILKKNQISISTGSFSRVFHRVICVCAYFPCPRKCPTMTVLMSLRPGHRRILKFQEHNNSNGDFATRKVI